MGRGDNRFGDDRGRDRYRGERSDRGGRGNWDDRGGRDDDRGFFDRAGDQVRSWFGDEDAERRRDADERERGWNDDDRGSGYRGHRDRGQSFRREEGGFNPSGGARGAEVWGGSGFGGDYDRGRRFDRIDAGSTGTHGAHPMSSPAGAEGFGYGGPGYRSSAREAAIYAASDRSRAGHDPHYSEWRQRQIDALDRDYDDYRREHQSKFEQEFGSWRERRQGQRQSLRQVSEHMDVVGSDGEHVGKVDKVRGDRIILAKNDPESGGHHHSIPCSWIDRVEDKVVIGKTAEEAKRVWRDEETNRALFERDDQGREGPHALDRAFSGTYRA